MYIYVYCPRCDCVQSHTFRDGVSTYDYFECDKCECSLLVHPERDPKCILMFGEHAWQLLDSHTLECTRCGAIEDA